MTRGEEVKRKGGREWKWMDGGRTAIRWRNRNGTMGASVE